MGPLPYEICDSGARHRACPEPVVGQVVPIRRRGQGGWDKRRPAATRKHVPVSNVWQDVVGTVISNVPLFGGHGTEDAELLV